MSIARVVPFFVCLPLIAGLLTGCSNLQKKDQTKKLDQAVRAYREFAGASAIDQSSILILDQLLDQAAFGFFEYGLIPAACAEQFVTSAKKPTNFRTIKRSAVADRPGRPCCERDPVSRPANSLLRCA